LLTGSFIPEDASTVRTESFQVFLPRLCEGARDLGFGLPHIHAHQARGALLYHGHADIGPPVYKCALRIRRGALYRHEMRPGKDIGLSNNFTIAKNERRATGIGPAELVHKRCALFCLPLHQQSAKHSVQLLLMCNEKTLLGQLHNHGGHLAQDLTIGQRQRHHFAILIKKADTRRWLARDRT